MFSEEFAQPAGCNLCGRGWWRIGHIRGGMTVRICLRCDDTYPPDVVHGIRRRPGEGADVPDMTALCFAATGTAICTAPVCHRGDHTPGLVLY
jgi:hypothetical protein